MSKFPFFKTQSSSILADIKSVAPNAMEFENENTYTADEVIELLSHHDETHHTHLDTPAVKNIIRACIAANNESSYQLHQGIECLITANQLNQNNLVLLLQNSSMAYLLATRLVQTTNYSRNNMASGQDAKMNDVKDKKII